MSYQAGKTDEFIDPCLIADSEGNPVGLIKENDSVIDVGANIGYWATVMSKAVGPKGKVISLEPASVSYRILEKNLALNSCKNVTAFQLGASDVNGSAALVFDENLTHQAHVAKKQTGIESTRTNTIECTTLDELFAAHGFPPPSFLKIDVEGFEMNVLQGARNLLVSADVTVLFEYHHKPADTEKDDIEAFHAFARSIGYSIFELPSVDDDCNLECRPLLSIADNFSGNLVMKKVV